MSSIVISGSGYYLPDDIISNKELVNSFNAYAETATAEEIGDMRKSSSDFIERASGIRKRHVIDKRGILDVNNMRPSIAARSDNELSVQAELSVKAAEVALREANKSPNEIDAVIVACSNM